MEQLKKRVSSIMPSPFSPAPTTDHHAAAPAAPPHSPVAKQPSPPPHFPSSLPLLPLHPSPSTAPSTPSLSHHRAAPRPAGHHTLTTLTLLAPFFPSLFHNPLSSPTTEPPPCHRTKDRRCAASQRRHVATTNICLSPNSVPLPTRFRRTPISFPVS
nr:lysine-rich arabinogalactan protein 19-like [Arachis hypogaea]